MADWIIALVKCVAVIAMVLATPVAVGIALFVSHYAPRRLGQPIGFVIDLLAAVPSVIFGLWGFYVFGPWLMPTQKGLIEYLGFIPLFDNPDGVYATDK